MDDTEILSSLNEYIATEDSTPVTLASSFYQSILRDSILLHNSSQSDLLIQAFIGRYFIRSGERVVVSLANKRMIRREMYPEIKHTAGDDAGNGHGDVGVRFGEVKRSSKDT